MSRGYGGWTDDMIVGKQHIGDTVTGKLRVDYNVFHKDWVVSNAFTRRGLLPAPNGNPPKPAPTTPPLTDDASLAGKPPAVGRLSPAWTEFWNNGATPERYELVDGVRHGVYTVKRRA